MKDRGQASEVLGAGGCCTLAYTDIRKDTNNKSLGVSSQSSAVAKRAQAILGCNKARSRSREAVLYRWGRGMVGRRAECWCPLKKGR